MSNDDEDLILDFTLLKDNEKELRKYFSFLIRNDGSMQHKIKISILGKKWAIHFRRHKPFEKVLYLNEKPIEETNIGQSIELLFNDMKDYTKKNFKKTL